MGKGKWKKLDRVDQFVVVDSGVGFRIYDLQAISRRI